MKQFLKDIWKVINNEHGWIAAAIPAAIAVGQAVAGAMKKKKEPPQADVTGLLNQINVGKQRQSDIAANAYGQLPGKAEQYKTDVGIELTAAEDAARQKSQQFLSDIGKDTTLQGKKLSDILAQRVLERQPELQKQMRNAVAGTGGLQRGAAVIGGEQLATQASKDISTGNEDIALQQQEAMNQAKEKVFNLDQGLVQQRLGINKDMLTALFDIGRTDLINEAMTMLGIEQNAQTESLAVQGFQTNQDLASRMAAAEAANKSKSDLLSGGIKGLSSIDWASLLKGNKQND